MGLFTVFTSQTALLLRKNIKMQLRSPLASVTQTSIGVVFLVILRLMDLAVTQNRWNEAEVETRTPSVQDTPLLRCHVGRDTALPHCYTFVYAPNLTDRSDGLAVWTDGIVGDVLARAGLPATGSPHGALGFADEAAIDTWLYNNPNTTGAAVIFRDDGRDNVTRRASYTLQVRRTEPVDNGLQKPLTVPASPPAKVREWHSQ